MKERTCPECGAVFSPRTGGQVCCSHECARARNNRQKKERRKGGANAAVEAMHQLRVGDRKEQLARQAKLRARLARRDLAYKQLAVPVSQHVENGVSVEWRGQPRIGCCAVGVVNHNA